MGVNRPRNMCSNSSRSAQSGRPLALLSLVALLVLSFATVLPAVSGSFPAAAQNEAEMVVTRKLLESANPEVLKKSFFNFKIYNNTCTDDRVSSTLVVAKLDRFFDVHVQIERQNIWIYPRLFSSCFFAGLYCDHDYKTDLCYNDNDICSRRELLLTARRM